MNRPRLGLRAAAVCAVLPVLAAGCAGTPPVVGDEGWGPAVPELPVEAGTQGSIYRDSGLQLFGDLRARSVGDVLTITLDEQTAGLIAMRAEDSRA